MQRINPWTLSKDIADDKMRVLLDTAIRLMKANAGPGGNQGRDFEGGGPNKPWVYKRKDQACRVCGTPIQRALIGKEARSVYWCRNCQKPLNAETKAADTSK